MVNKLNLRPLAKIISYADSEVAPVDFCLAPISATEKALERANKKLEDICYFEYNEAFSTTALAI
jgi:acetyl-CoA C-acetyltransferase